MKTILLSAPYMLPFLDRFRPILNQYNLQLITPEVSERLNEEQILVYAGQFDGTICGDDKYTPRVLQACHPRLKVISKWGTGIDSIDSQEAQRLGISVFRTSNAFTLPVSDTVIGYMLAFARKHPWMDRDIKSGQWIKIPGRALHECTLGIIGVGAIGKVVARKARAFGMTVLGNDIVDIDHVFIAETGIQMMPLDELLQKADFVSVNCDLNSTSRHLITTNTLNQMKPTAILINTARGPIVDEEALVEALMSGRIAGAALDVFEVEPLPLDSPLMKMDNVMLAPHNSNSSPTAWEHVHWNTIQNLLLGLGLDSGKVVRNETKPR